MVFDLQNFAGMKTLLIQGHGAVPRQVREIVQAGSTERKEIRADEERDATTLEADRIVFWDEGDIEVRAPHNQQDAGAKLRWPQDEDKLRMFFQTGG